jgi:hypothetical protein
MKAHKLRNTRLTAIQTRMLTRVMTVCGWRAGRKVEGGGKTTFCSLGDGIDSRMADTADQLILPSGGQTAISDDGLRWR